MMMANCSGRSQPRYTLLGERSRPFTTSEAVLLRPMSLFYVERLMIGVRPKGCLHVRALRHARRVDPIRRVVVDGIRVGDTELLLREVPAACFLAGGACDLGGAMANSAAPVVVGLTAYPAPWTLRLGRTRRGHGATRLFRDTRPLVVTVALGGLFYERAN